MGIAISVLPFLISSKNKLRLSHLPSRILSPASRFFIHKIVGLYVFFRFSGYLLGNIFITRMNTSIGAPRSFDWLCLASIWLSLVFFFVITFPELMAEPLRLEEREKQARE